MDYYILTSILLIVISIFIIYYIDNYEGFESNEKDNIIGYIHVCQKDKWTKSYDMIYDKIKKSGLYDASTEIRLGILTENGNHVDNKRFNDPKIKIIYNGKYDEYERPTLLHMRKSSDTDPKNTKYYYLHTKGISHFGTEREQTAIDWINSMLYWNVQKWKNAVIKLNKYETYGCHYNNTHYAGNFWWATNSHINKLPNNIPSYYTAPEDWVLINKNKNYCAYNCGNNFKHPYNEVMKKHYKL